jgi:glutamate-5-semialdehyde dehydrogenase
VDKLADMDTAVSIAFDSKTQYTAVCNAAETLLVHAKKAGKFLPLIVTKLKDAGVEVRGCAKTRKIVSGLKMAKSVDWSTEYLDLIISIKVVDSMARAVEHINKYGSGHTDTIVTKSKTRANAFMNAVDSACVFHNASTRFSDGYRFGLGAELGISTNKTHARGPVGVEGLVLYKFRLYGEGQVVADYSDAGGKKFTHKKLPVS